MQLRAQGTASADGLRQARELGFVSRLARNFSGSTAYNLALTFRRGQPEVLVTSNLQGLAVISANSGNNVAINSAMNVTINLAR